MKVLVVCPFFPYDPIRPYSGIFVGEQVQMLRQLGVEAHVVTFVPWTPWPVSALKPKWKELAQIPSRYSWRDIEVIVHRYPVLPRNRALDIAARVMERLLYQDVVASEPDLIHAHFAYPTGFAAVRCARRLSIPVVLTVHGSDVHTVPNLAKRYRADVMEALKGATRVLAVSEFMKAEVLKLCADSAVIVHRIGIDLLRFKVRDSKTKLAGVDGPVVLYVGNLVKDKGVMDLLNAFRGVEDLGAHLIYVGSGPMARDLALRTAELGLSGRVWLLGAQPPDKIPHLLSGADVLALPSYREGLGMICVEALACGVPVIATNTGGIPEVIRHNETGLLVPPGDVEALAKALRWVLLNEAEAIKLALAGRCLVEQRYNLKANTQSLIEVYRDVLSAARSNRDAWR